MQDRMKRSKIYLIRVSKWENWEDEWELIYKNTAVEDFSEIMREMKNLNFKRTRIFVY